MHFTYHCFSLEVTMEYLFGHDFDAISAPQFCNTIVVSMQECLPTFSVIKHFPLVFNLHPHFLRLKINSSAQGLVNILITCQGLIDEVLTNSDQPLGNASHETIFHHLIISDAEKCSGSTLSRRRLSEEVHLLREAGSNAVGGTCTIGTFYVLRDGS